MNSAIEVVVSEVGRGRGGWRRRFGGARSVDTQAAFLSLGRRARCAPRSRPPDALRSKVAFSFFFLRLSERDEGGHMIHTFCSWCVPWRGG